jgi:two-component system sensor histidine kinase/response regulator
VDASEPQHTLAIGLFKLLQLEGCARDPQKQELPVPFGRGKMSRANILVVEDHVPLRAAIKQVLEAADYAVLTATDGVEALEAMKQVLPDLIVADIMMPRMDGYDFYDAVRSQPEMVPIPFIFLTAKAEKEDVLKGKQMGAEDYIVKPFDPQELLVIIKARLGRAHAIREAAEEEFVQLKREIVNMLSHELRTPLTYIQGYASLALDDIPNLSPEALEEFLQAIKQGADRLTRLVEDSLILVRLDTGQAEQEYNMLVKKHDDLGDIVKKVVEKWNERAAAQNIALEINAAPSLPPVRLCRSFFEDTLGRLIDNAIKFTKKRGKTVTVSSRAADDWVEIAIQDRGVGLSADEIPRLFTRFRQLNRETMEQQGTGLGLAISQELIALHGGEIVVDSTLGEGSTFTIRLPVAE